MQLVEQVLLKIFHVLVICASTFAVLTIFLMLILTIFRLRYELSLYLYQRRKSSLPTYNLKSFQHQRFSLPYHYMLYIADKPSSPKVAEKLQKTCKFFFARQPILIVDIFRSSYFEEDEISYSVRKKNWKTRPLFDKRETLNKLSKLPKNVSFWLMRDFKCQYYENIGELILPKIYKISLKSIHLDDVILSEAEFEKLAFSGKLERLNLQNVPINNNNDPNEHNKKWTWFEIYKKLPYLTNFEYWRENEITDVETIQKLHTLEHKTKLRLFDLSIIVTSPFYDLIYLWKFIKDNATPHRESKYYSGGKWAFFRFKFRNANLETDFSRFGQTSLAYYQIELASHPHIIPNYDENEFFENNVVSLS